MPVCTGRLIFRLLLGVQITLNLGGADFRGAGQIDHFHALFLQEIELSLPIVTHDEGIDVVVARVDIAYKLPLKSGDSFVSKLALAFDGIKYTFYQQIYRLSDMKLCIRAKTDCVATEKGKLTQCKKLNRLIENILQKP